MTANRNERDTSADQKAEGPVYRYEYFANNILWM